MSEPWRRSAPEIAGAVRRGELRAVDVWDGLQAHLHGSPSLRSAFVRLEGEEGRRRAEDIDRRRATGQPLGRLAGVPVAVKDNMAIVGRHLSCGSRMLSGFRSTYTATAVARLLAEDALLVGQTKLDEFAMGSSGEHFFEAGERGGDAPVATVETAPQQGEPGSDRPEGDRPESDRLEGGQLEGSQPESSGLESDWPENPWRRGRVPGGSSSGSAVAVARGLPLALGSDTGGSVRQPAAFCGVVGLRPSYGRVSRRGLVAFASTFDQIGPLSSDVAGAALALEVMAGADPRDATCAEQPPPDLLAGLEGGLEGLRLGVPSQVEAAGLGACALAEWRRSLEVLASLGGRLETVDLPSPELAVAAYSVLSSVEASSNLARFDGVRYGFRAAADGVQSLYAHSRGEGFGPEVARRLTLGTHALSGGAGVLEGARSARRRLAGELAEILGRVDLLVTPTAAGGAFERGEKFHHPVAMSLTDAFTAPASLAGLPALAVPTGLDRDGLPLSLQIVGRRFGEDVVLRAGRALERAVAFEDHRPPGERRAL